MRIVEAPARGIRAGHMGGFVIAATGLVAEARIVERPGVRALSCGGRSDVLADSLRRAVADGAIGIVSFGIAGGLVGHLEPGACIIAEAVVCPAGIRYGTDGDWRDKLASRLGSAAVTGTIAGVDKPVGTRAAKHELHARTGAAIADMESHVAARIAHDHALPFAAVRVVADPAHRALPEAALNGMKPDGSPDVLAVLRSLAARPRQLPDLLRVAMDTRAALGALLRSHHLLAPELARA